MSTPISKQKYAKPPIIEAVLEIVVAGEIERKLQEKLVERFKATYPHATKRQAVNVKIDATAEKISVEQEPQGYRLSNEEQTEVVLVMPRAIAVARLAPYLGWDVLREQALAAWKIWKASTPGFGIERLGIRFINRIDIPVEPEQKIALQDYLTTYPQIGGVTNAPLSGYLMQVAAPTNDHQWSMTMTSTMVVPPPLLNHMSILVDIDVFRTEAIPLNEKELWPIIDSARAIKNDLFERCLTEKTRKLFA